LQSTIKERAFFDSHNILHFVDKEDPRGDRPSDPKSDPSYKNWEDGVEDFYKDKDDIIFAEEPRECRSDDFEDEKPSISLKLENKGSEVEIKVEKDAPYDIDEYIYIVNGKEVEKFDGDRYRYSVPEDQKGTTIEIRVKIEDELGNKADASGKIQTQE